MAAPSYPIIVLNKPTLPSQIVTVKPTRETIAQHYFGSQYPSNTIWQRFSKNNPFREYAFFILKHAETEAFMMRHLHFITHKDFVDAINHFRPIRIEVGGIHFTDTCDATDIIAHEIVFDIDIDAYDAFLQARSCGCCDANFCRSCWKLVITAANMIITRLLLQGVAKTEVELHYSGGRGLHIRVFSDQYIFSAPERSIREAVRRSIVGDIGKVVTPIAMERYVTNEPDVYTMVMKQLFDKTTPVFLGWYLDEHPLAVWQVLSTVTTETLKRFQQYASKKQLQIDAQTIQFNLRTVAAILDQHMSFITQLNLEMVKLRTSQQTPCAKTIGLRSYVESVAIAKPLQQQQQYKLLFRDIDQLAKLSISALHGDYTPYSITTDIPWNCTLNYALVVTAMMCLWPRVDKGPTDQPTHLLRAPNGIHLSTGRVGIQIDIDGILSFYPPDSSPTVQYENGNMTFAIV